MPEIGRLLRRDGKFILGLLIVFVMVIFLGYFLSKINPEFARFLSQEMLAKFSRLLGAMKGKPLYYQILVIFFNNLLAAFLAILTGILIIPFFLPVFPVAMLMGNALIIGVALRMTEVKMGLSSSSFVLGLLPHGIFEVPAFLIAVMLGIRLGFLPHRLLWHYSRTKEYQPLFRDYFRELPYYGVLILVLLSVAAILEITVSGAMVKGL